ncbi:MAG: hypothetical protein IJE84_00040, partial [Clostridia bacterium]|nr:hypothetical protein [Clostridia bacterium]
VFVAIYADDVDKIPSGTFTIQTDRFGDNPRSYIYTTSGSISGATTTDATRLIVNWDANYIYVNAAASTRPWPPSPVKFTMICVA